MTSTRTSVEYILAAAAAAAAAAGDAAATPQVAKA